MIISLLFIMSFVGWFVAGAIKQNDDIKEGSYVYGGFVVLALFMFFAGFRLSVPGEVREFRAVQQTLLDARGNAGISAIELAAIQTEIIKANRWLAGTQFYAKNLWTNWFVPASVLDLKPIK